jgi:uncharacterized membrane protein YqhA
MTDFKPPPPTGAAASAMKALAASRYLIIIAVLATLVAATALLAYGAVETFTVLRSFVTPDPAGPKGAKGLMLSLIELTDLFLLATVLYVIAIGLFELFVDDRLNLPKWLEIHDLNDLKEKLIGVLVVVMGVLFLGQVVTWDGERNLLPYGAAIALVIAALTYFTSQKPKKGL